MLSHTEQEVLENICRGSGAALLDIHSIISKVYDDELAYDLNRQAAKYSRFRERAAGSGDCSAANQHPGQDKEMDGNPGWHSIECKYGARGGHDAERRE